MKRCDRCGANVVDVVGTRQACLFDVAPADPRATDAARAELRAGRVLCSACQRVGELFPGDASHPADRCTGCNTPLGTDHVGSLCPECDATRIRNGGEPHDDNGKPSPWIDNGDGTERRSTLEPFPTLSPVVVTAPADPFPRPVVDHWTRKDAARYPVTDADRADGRPLIGHHWAFEDRDDEEPVIGMLDGRLVEVVCK